jgi:hypothetical protein
VCIGLSDPHQPKAVEAQGIEPFEQREMLAKGCDAYMAELEAE